MHNISVVWLPRLARSPGGLGGRSRIEFIVSPLPRRRHNESHFAAQSPERSFFFPLFLSAEKEKEVIGGEVAKSLSLKQSQTVSLPLEGKVPEGRMRCRLRVAEPFTNEKVTLCFVTRCRATPHHRLRAELSRCGSCQ